MAVTYDISNAIRDQMLRNKHDWRSMFYGGGSVASNAVLYYWNEDNLEPRDPLPWLDYALQAVRGRAWS